MKILVTGGKGQLAYDLNKEILKRHHQLVSVDKDDMDITNAEAVDRVISAEKPDCVIHTAAFTAVDDAEENVELCTLINKTGTKNIVDACKKIDCKLIYLSTDYVFDGKGTNEWKPDDERKPLNVYGKTKCDGEICVQNLSKYYIVRISWVFGINGKNFVKTMLSLAKSHNQISVVNDQIGSPTYTADIAVLLCDMAEEEKYGIYHATNSGEYISWYDFANKIFELSKKSVKVVPVSSKEFSAKANRPSNSRLDKSKLSENGFIPLPTWQDALKRYLKELGELK